MTVDERIAAAALEILRAKGPAAVTIEAVSQQSGVAKTTIYRRHDNRASLLRAVIDSSTTSTAVPEGLTAYGVLRWFIGHARESFENVFGRGAVAAMLVNDDPEFTTLLLGMVRARSQPLREDLHERIATGELREGLDVELLISMLLGTFMAEAIRGHEAVETWADNVLSLVWPAVTSTPAP